MAVHTNLYPVLWFLITKYNVKINIEMINYKLQKYTQVQGFNIDEFLENQNLMPLPV